MLGMISHVQGLKHQKNWKGGDTSSSNWYDRGAKTGQATKFRKGACENCGAMTHKSKECVERPRTKGAKLTGKHIAADEKIQSFDLNWEGKHDRYNGYDPAECAAPLLRPSCAPPAPPAPHPPPSALPDRSSLAAAPAGTWASPVCAQESCRLMHQTLRSA